MQKAEKLKLDHIAFADFLSSSEALDQIKVAFGFAYRDSVLSKLPFLSNGLGELILLRFVKANEENALKLDVYSARKGNQGPRHMESLFIRRKIENSYPLIDISIKDQRVIDNLRVRILML